MIPKKLTIFLLLLIFLSSCTKIEQKTPNKIDPKTQALTKCIELCKATTKNLENGPCLSNEIIKDWVCDIAHSPRKQIDNLPENQCSAFIKGLAHHFIELDKNCKLIKAY